MRDVEKESPMDNVLVGNHRFCHQADVSIQANLRQTMYILSRK